MLNKDTFIEALKSTVAELIVQYGQGLVLNTTAYERMESLAELADMLASEFEAESCDLRIDATGGLSTFHIEVFDIVFRDGRKHPFFDIIQKADCLNFSNADDNVLISFGIKGVLTPNE